MTDGLDLLHFSAAPRLPIVRQSEAGECGLACLTMVATYHGYKTSLNNLRLRYPISLKGATLKGLISIAGRLGLSSRPLRVDLDALKRLQMPCVLHWNMNHFVVLKSVKRGIFRIHDPALGERRFTQSQISSNFTGIALELSPGPTFKPREERRSMRLTDLWEKTFGLKKVLLQTLLLSVIVQLMILAAPFYMQLVVDEVLSRFDTHILVILALGFSLLMLINVAATALRAYLILHISSQLGFQMTSNLFRHLLTLPLQWYEKRHVGDILSRFSSTQPIRDLFTEGLVAAVIDGLMAISTLLLIFFYSYRLGFIVVVALACYLLLRLILYRPLHQKNEEQIVAVAQEQSTFIESVRGIQSIKIFGHETQRQAIWQNKYADVINSGVKLGKLQIFFDAANGLLFGIENTVIIYYGALLVTDGSLTVGMLFAFMAYKRQFIDKATLLVERAIEFRLLGLHLERISDIGLATSEHGLAIADSKPLINTTSAADGKIEFSRVSFRYSTEEPWVLRGISLTINRGEMISFIGPSGCGKTSLMKLLLGLFEPAEGEILYGGMRLERYGHTRYRGKIGTVMQDDALLAGSIADNIAFFDITPDLGKIQLCAEKAAIHTDIAAMPMAYDSLVGDMGGSLSAGQRQRILLARALYRDPDILILDEGTANLDAITEASIIRMLGQLDITRICVAHREPMILASNRIVLLKSGALHELDKQQFLAARRGDQVMAI